MVNHQAHRIITFIGGLRALDRENVSTALDRYVALSHSTPRGMTVISSP